MLWDESKPWDDPTNNERQMLEAKDPYRYVMEQPMALPHGELFNYCGGATSLLRAALAKMAGQRLDAYAGEKLFGPLAIKDFEWLSCTGSTEVAAFGGLRLKPRDLAKLGQLVANDGRWNAKHLVWHRAANFCTASILTVTGGEADVAFRFRSGNETDLCIEFCARGVLIQSFVTAKQVLGGACGDLAAA